MGVSREVGEYRGEAGGRGTDMIKIIRNSQRIKILLKILILYAKQAHIFCATTST